MADNEPNDWSWNANDRPDANSVTPPDTPYGETYPPANPPVPPAGSTPFGPEPTVPPAQPKPLPAYGERSAPTSAPPPQYGERSAPTSAPPPQYGQYNSAPPNVPPAQYGQYNSAPPNVPPAQYGQTGPYPGANYQQMMPLSYPKPGIIPLRPLGLGDLLDGSFAAIRTNPMVMFAFSLLVMSIVAAIAFLLFLLSPINSIFDTIDNPAIATGSSSTDELNKIASMLAGAAIALAGSSLLTYIATTIINGMLTIAVADAVTGKITSLNDAWRRVLPRILPLIGFTLILSFAGTLIIVGITIVLVFVMAGLSVSVGVIAVASVLFFIGVFLGAVFFQIRLIFAPMCITLEEVGPIRGMSRSWTLTKGLFWRTFGYFLLVTLILSMIMGTIGAIGGGIVGAICAGLGVSPGMSYAISNALGTIVSGIGIPLSAAFLALLYIDARIRKEGLAQTLIAASQQKS